MKQIVMILALSVAIPCLVHSQAGNKNFEILNIRKEWYDAYFRGVTLTMARIETSNFVVITGNAIEEKREYGTIQKAVNENRWMPKGTRIIDEEKNVRIIGNMAVIYGQYWIKVPGYVEKPPENKTAFTEVWVKHEGSWRVMQLHLHQLVQNAPK